ncbi:LEAF RUST 10 DISEASE-RESISTANCE LOCUS RECEPTOR-LIKE PROTEIN KINASE-like 1.4 isoform X3 [Chenopodium quinoa]|uniref:LEAF RUST 10 DISEASE-RESISTANCE LOCUS RECEPTOR-LIKE PROTEIN KINASE-like 1.4 isoform X3 n=1 Tax=Chenopodium quinoa TaxID=63459 RepID=UPI000B77431C|nr:LEAF RUST 10 DISEASE-RESISTANCE LOCUS RECEPTOR-LIKE PROTEIN KINASE-like 1.4 isoform X3 [Chenopodium quinoa]
MKLSFQSSFFLMIIIFLLILLHVSVEANKYKECKSLIQCGGLSDIGYPFFDEKTRPDYCGYPGFKLDCDNEYGGIPEISVTQSLEKHRLLNINTSSRTISVTPKELWNTSCPENLFNTTLNYTLYKYTDEVANFTFYYDCPTPSPVMSSPGSAIPYDCLNINYSFPVVYFKIGVKYIPQITCQSNIIVPLFHQSRDILKDSDSVKSAFEKGFELEWIADNEKCDDCQKSGGECGYDFSQRNFTCYHGGTKPAVIIGVSVGGALVAAALLCCSIFAVRRRRQSLAQAQSKDLGPSNPSNGLPTTATSNEYRYSQGYTTSPSTNLSQSLPSYPSSKSEFENSADYLGVKVFGYNELEEATEHFHESRELGDGGFGTVYYGKLNDGRLVAVKRLYENSCRHMGQFMNEIHILARLRHKNLVALYGCTSRRSRELLLVYEYVSNGTVADHLHGKLAQSNVLSWSTRLSIAVETAEALSFLHENDVIHRDVKTTNILLEDSFKVKVADFGLSRLFPDNVTHVSTAPQGTPGYVDPEYYQCYQLSEKSDVYSFGVVLAELISSKVAVDITRHRHDINLANMAVDRIQKHAFNELVDPKLWCEKDHLAQKMVKLVAEVAFQCLQQEKEARPSMKEVLESLKGIQKELENSQKQVVVDIHENDDVGLLKNVPPPVSPETEPSNKSIR